eukprot:5094185-Pyramimonas_sp.AAC.1
MPAGHPRKPAEIVAVSSCLDRALASDLASMPAAAAPARAEARRPRRPPRANAPSTRLLHRVLGVDATGPRDGASGRDVQPIPARANNRVHNAFRRGISRNAPRACNARG